MIEYEGRVFRPPSEAYSLIVHHRLQPQQVHLLRYVQGKAFPRTQAGGG